MALFAHGQVSELSRDSSSIPPKLNAYRIRTNSNTWIVKAHFLNVEGTVVHLTRLNDDGLLQKVFVADMTRLLCVERADLDAPTATT